MTADLTRRRFLQSLSGAALCSPTLGPFGLRAVAPIEGMLGPRRGPHHAPRAKALILLYMDGGPSQVDTFDYKPRLQRDHGKPFAMRKEPTQFNDDGNTLGSPWKFAQHGECGQWVSELFPHVAGCVDRLALIRSMTSEFSEHTTANYFLHTGTGLQGRPSLGAWITFGLGADSAELPAHIVLHGGLIPAGGLDCFGSSFLPATFQGSLLRTGDQPLANLHPHAGNVAGQRARLALTRRLDELGQRAFRDPQVDAAIANQELAARMQRAVPEVMGLVDESAATRRLYGLDADDEHTRTFAAQCLAARRLVERGVRFVELTCPRIDGADRWDQHGRLVEDHARNAGAVDQPIAGLLQDLAARGLLDETLVVWTGEFGRTPFAQGRDGRDHNPFGFTSWLAGGGVRGGVAYGETDEYGYRAVRDPVSMHDLHATLLHLLGIDHTRLTFRFGGRDIRLTDVHGEVVAGVLA